MPELEHAGRFLNSLVRKAQENFDPGSTQLFDTTALYGLHSLEVSDGRVVCKLPVVPRNMNRFGTLHGGCMATLVDTVGNAALRTKLDNTGVSLHIATTYMLPADLAITKPLNGLVC
ncbi:hypothetical protein WJX84_003688 [Apatococcus fuscideae]|uniref:Thioesterase domain-containing protein n=1 Tax=Apatococcus fuscideae TaxID=2026836 RepID=A0AAW1SHV8_9CHLO